MRFRVGGGYSTGYEDGYTAGDSAGYTRGYTNGDSDGYARGYNAGRNAFIGTTIGSGKLHSVGTGTQYTVTQEGTYYATVGTADNRNSGAQYTFTHNGTSCKLTEFVHEWQVRDGATGSVVQNGWTHSATMLEYCRPGDVLTCNANCTWYRVY